jgi:NAD(P)-dependent dehydrogenase (short-subunit alcohol dehydrogenase family)
MSKTVLITGTSSGFGRIGAELIAGAGHRVFATMRDIEGRNAEAARALSAIPNIEVVPLEMASVADNEAAAARAVAATGRLDVVINNAGSFTMGVGESFTDADILRLYDLDVLGPWRMTRAALPYMRTQKEGAIITVSSSLARFSCPFMTVYASGKHALEGLLQGMKYELKPFNIDVSFIEPGIHPTHVFDRSSRGSDVARNAEYGPLGGMADKIKADLDALFASGHASDPRRIGEAMLKLVETKQGERPIRVVADPNAGPLTERLNQLHAELYLDFLRGSGMGALVD